MKFSYLKLTSKLHYLFFSLFLGTFYNIFLFNNFLSSDVETAFYINNVLLLFCFFAATSQQSISIYWLHSFFMLVFLNIIPGIQWKLKIFYYFRNGSENLESLAFQANVLIFIWNVIFLTFYVYFQKRYSFSPKISPKYSSVNVVISLFVMMGLILALVFSVGASFLIYRYTVFDEVGGKTSSPQLMLYSYFVKPVAFFIPVIFFICVKGKWPLKIALIVAGVILNFPLAVARFYLLGLIFSMYAVFFAYKYRTAWRLFAICIFGFFFSFLLTLLRFLSPTNSLHQIFTEKSVTIIGGMDTDAFETTMLTLRYIGQHGFIWGYNILACLFFWVPRGVWTEKPTATNALVVDAGSVHKTGALLENFTTISCPIVAESYISFGIAGIILFALILSYFAAVLDKHFKTTCNSTELGHKIYRVYYGGLVGLLFLLFRGSLMAGYSYAIGFTLAFIFTLAVYGISYKLNFTKVKRRRTTAWGDTINQELPS